MSTQLTAKKKLLVWLLIVIAYVLKFGTALVAGWHYLAKDIVRESNVKGGIFYYTFIGVVVFALFISILKLINKMKANAFKTLFKGFTSIAVVYTILLLAVFINTNVLALTKVLQITISGMFLGTILEAYIVWKFNNYIREVGIF